MEAEVPKRNSGGCGTRSLAVPTAASGLLFNALTLDCSLSAILVILASGW